MTTNAPRSRPSSATRSHPVVLVGLALVAVQVAARAWASAGSWFIGDDFNLMTRLHGVPLTLTELFTPHDSQLMPGGIFFAWLMTGAGPHDWTVGATILVALQALASLSCLLMLVTVFGKQWAILPLLLVYLASPLTLTAYMWWAAAINQVPLHAAFFLTVTAAVRYFRTRRLLWLGLTFLSVLVGMAFYVKAVLILPVVAGVGLLFFAPVATTVDPRLGSRASAAVTATAGTLRTYAPMWAVLAVVGAAYTVLYVRLVDNPLEGYDLEWAMLADNFFRISLGPALVGGPWQWWNPNPPAGLVDPPSWAVTATWIGYALTAYWLHQRGTARWRALFVLGGYLAADYFLLAVGRGSVFGPIAGLELRYLADTTPVIVLAFGLLLLDSRQTSDSAASWPALPRDRDARRGLLVPLAVCTALVAGAGWSTWQYVALWHADYVAKVYTQNVAAAAELHDIHLVDEWVPQTVVSPLRFPDNLISRVFRPLPGVHASTSGTDLQILDESGVPQRAEVAPGLEAPSGPVEGCGYPVRDQAQTISLEVPEGAEPLEPSWWVKIDYLSGADGDIKGKFGDLEVEFPVRRGLHQYLLQGEGPIEEVTLKAEDSRLVLCVDRLMVGKVQVWDKTQ